MSQRLPSALVLQQQSLRMILYSYLQLTKPRIMLLVLLTGATSLVLEGSLVCHPARFLLVLVGLYLTGGCANALNQYFERDIDARMLRTRSKRPLPLQRLTATHALVFSVAIGVAGTLVFAIYFNWLTAGLAMASILFYSLAYTLWLKPTTWRNIVIGGIVGAMVPVGAWTAASGTTTLMPWLLFLIVFFWTPPHFWSLSLMISDDYERVGYPMLPAVKGERATLNQILGYTVLLAPISLLPVFVDSGRLYLIAASILGAIFISKAHWARRSRDTKMTRALFHYSILYLFAICAALVLDKLL